MLKKLESWPATAAGANAHCWAHSLSRTLCGQNPVRGASRQKEKLVWRVQPQHHKAGYEMVGLELRNNTLITSIGGFQWGQGSLISFEGPKTVIVDGSGGKELACYQLFLCPNKRSQIHDAWKGQFSHNRHAGMEKGMRWVGSRLESTCQGCSHEWYSPLKLDWWSHLLILQQGICPLEGHRRMSGSVWNYWVSMVHLLGMLNFLKCFSGKIFSHWKVCCGIATRSGIQLLTDQKPIKRQS